jgi:hypothetical protein
MARSFKDQLEIGTNILIIVVVLLIGGNYLRSRATHRVPGPAVGDRIVAPKSYDWRAHAQTLVVAVRKGCVYCEHSYPLYRRLNELESSNQLKAHMLIVMPDDPATGAALLSAEKINSQSIASVPLSDVNVSGTPTLLLVNETGRVLQSWVGELDASRTEALVTQLRR